MKKTLLSNTLIMAQFCLLFGYAGSPAIAMNPGEERGQDGGNTILLPLVLLRNGEDVLSDQTEELSEETIDLITSINEDGSQIVFETTNSEINNLQSGDIIISGVTEATPYGLLRKVSTKQDQGGNIVLNTTEASLDEAFQELSVELEQNLTSANITAFTSVPGVILIQTPETSASGNFEFALDDVVLHDNDGNLSTIGDQVLANGMLIFSPAIKFRMSIVNFEVKEIFFSQTMSTQESMSVTSKISLSTPLVKEIPLTMPIPLGALPIPGLPLVVTPELEVVCGINGTVFAGISSTVTQTSSFTAGVQYKDDQWQTFGENNNSFSYRQENFSSGLSFKAYVGPKLTLLINKVAGPYIKVNLGMKLDITPMSNPLLALKGGLEIPLGVTVKIFSRVLLDFQHVAIDYWLLLYSVSSSQSMLNFDEVDAPCVFRVTSALRDQYASVGVHFYGPDDLDGGAILNFCGNFHVTNYSPPNFLAFNSSTPLWDGGLPIAPETIRFDSPVQTVRMKVGTGFELGQTLSLIAYDQQSNVLTYSSAVLYSDLREISVSAEGIHFVVISTPASIFVVDDISWE